MNVYDDDPDELAAHLRDAGATNVQRGDWVGMQSDPLGRMVGVVKRVAADGSWADVDWGRWTKRMQTAQLRVAVTLSLPNGWSVTDMTRAAEVAHEKGGGDGGCARLAGEPAARASRLV